MTKNRKNNFLEYCCKWQFMRNIIDGYILFLFGVFIGIYTCIYLINRTCDLNTDVGVGRLKINYDFKKYIYIGVLSNKLFLNTRFKASHETWGKSRLATVKYYAQSESEHESIVRLPEDVDDSVYPPQRKSFRMLQHMCKYVDSYQWFMRADDDSYVKIDKLIKFLSNIDARHYHYIGQAGFGREEEDVGLGNSIYCMGGPGMVFSSVLLKRMCPHIETCINNVASKHEDTEIGRCVNSYVGVNCTSSYEMRQLFYFHYPERQGSFSGPLNGIVSTIMKTALTLHPLKNKDYFYRFHLRILEIKAIELRFKMDSLKTQLEKPKIFNRYISKWKAFEYNTIVDSDRESPKRKVSEPWVEFFKKIYGDIFLTLKTEDLNLTIGISKFNDKKTKAYYIYDKDNGIDCHFELAFDSRNKLNRKR